MPDALFAEPRLAALYDILDDDRSDLDLYVGVVERLGATSVLDIGCGTGTLACRLTQTGVDVIGVDPAAASLDLARCKPGAKQVTWIHGDATSASESSVDLALMTGNVAQVFVTDTDWGQTLDVIQRAVRSGGWLVFESRDPAQRAWERWTKDHTHREITAPGIGTVTTWTELIDIAEPLVSFRHVFRFQRDGTELVSDSTLRFRTRDEIVESLEASGFHLRSIRDAPD